MLDIERRSSVRKLIRMACEVHFPGSVAIRGMTRHISLSGAEVEANSISAGGGRIPSPGEAGVLTLKFKHAGAPDSIKVQCQVVHILANGMGLSAEFSQLSQREQELLGRMLASGRPMVDVQVA